jgi:hypothetical protein
MLDAHASSLRKFRGISGGYGKHFGMLAKSEAKFIDMKNLRDLNQI